MLMYYKKWKFFAFQQESYKSELVLACSLLKSPRNEAVNIVFFVFFGAFLKTCKGFLV